MTVEARLRLGYNFLSGERFSIVLDVSTRPCERSSLTVKRMTSRLIIFATTIGLLSAALFPTFSEETADTPSSAPSFEETLQDFQAAGLPDEILFAVPVEVCKALLHLQRINQL